MSFAERHEDIDTARCWIEAEKGAKPTAFRLGQIFERHASLVVIATCDSQGWYPAADQRQAEGH